MNKRLRSLRHAITADYDDDSFIGVLMFHRYKFFALSVALSTAILVPGPALASSPENRPKQSPTTLPPSPPSGMVDQWESSCAKSDADKCERLAYYHLDYRPAPDSREKAQSYFKLSTRLRESYCEENVASSCLALARVLGRKPDDLPNEASRLLKHDINYYIERLVSISMAKCKHGDAEACRQIGDAENLEPSSKDFMQYWLKACSLGDAPSCVAAMNPAYARDGGISPKEITKLMKDFKHISSMLCAARKPDACYDLIKIYRTEKDLSPKDRKMIGPILEYAVSLAETSCYIGHDGSGCATLARFHLEDGPPESRLENARMMAIRGCNLLDERSCDILEKMEKDSKLP